MGQCNLAQAEFERDHEAAQYNSHRKGRQGGKDGGMQSCRQCAQN
jgi:hypothetical protein